MSATLIDPAYPKLDYSLRRYYVDEFHARRVLELPVGCRVLDLGGNKLRKRGQFDIERYDLRVTYANLITTKHPHVQANATHIPFKGSSFDAVICSELLEHVLQPPAVLREAYRVLRSGGTLLICVPFLVHIHSDPNDYGRYTDQYWRMHLNQIGFASLEIEKQGLFWSVLIDMVSGWVYQSMFGAQPLTWTRRLVTALMAWARRKALEHDAQAYYYQHPFFSRFTTGFGIRARK